MSEHMMREYYDRMESAKKKLAEETERFLDVLMEHPDEYAESIEVLRSLLRIFVRSDNLRIDMLIQREDWHRLDRILFCDVRITLEEVRRVEIRQESVRALEEVSDWYAQKTQYLECAEKQFSLMESEIHRCMLQGECYPTSPPAAVHFPAAPPPSGSEPKEKKKPSWWDRLFKRKDSEKKPGSPRPSVQLGDAPGFGDPGDRDDDFRPLMHMRDDFPGTALIDSTAGKPKPQPVIMDQVFFTAVAPKEFLRDEYSDVAVAMYEDAYRDIVDRIRENYDGQVTQRGSGAMEVARQTAIRVTIESPEADICFDNREETGIWIGKSLEFHFWVMVPEDFQKKQFKLTIRVFTDDIPFTTLTLFVKCNAPSAQEITPERRDIRSAFVSYARADTEEVTTLIRGMEKVRPDLSLFMDQESLRSGQNWQEVLKSEIERRDMLFLCWSHDAKASEWVDFEWRHMYSKRGVEHIDPIPLVSPQSCPPPEELAMLHFDDRWLHYRKHRPIPADGFIRIRECDSGIITPFRKKNILIGREYASDLRLNSNAVSRSHMQIEDRGGGRYFVRDLGSTNGSYRAESNERIDEMGLFVERGTKLRLADKEIEIL